MGQRPADQHRLGERAAGQLRPPDLERERMDKLFGYFIYIRSSGPSHRLFVSALERQRMGKSLSVALHLRRKRESVNRNGADLERKRMGKYRPSQFHL